MPASVERVKAFGEPSVDLSKKLASLIPLALVTPEAGHAHRSHRAKCVSRSRRELLQQRLGLLQIERIEAFGEPTVGRSEKIASLIPLALIAPEPRHADRRT